jgi:hypothetical protein
MQRNTQTHTHRHTHTHKLPQGATTERTKKINKKHHQERWVANFTAFILASNMLGVLNRMISSQSNGTDRRLVVLVCNDEYAGPLNKETTFEYWHANWTQTDALDVATVLHNIQLGGDAPWSMRRMPASAAVSAPGNGVSVGIAGSGGTQANVASMRGKVAGWLLTQLQNASSPVTDTRTFFDSEVCNAYTQSNTCDTSHTHTH